MPREELQRASAELRDASERESGDLQQRLYEQSNSLAELATADRGPDHGRLARIQSALDEMRAAAGDEAAARIETAREHVSAYRETVEGV